ncbi:MAG TPA: hypothetical protein VLA67_13055 [Nitrospiraceae bacterium]|nr:hypothetical protein [Nitrospiraceae bacterium]
MVTIPRVVGVLFCTVLLCLGLSKAAAAEELGTSRLDTAKTIKGQLSGIDYGEYIIKDKDGNEVRVKTNKKTLFMGQVQKGDRVEAKVTEGNLALSMRSLP